MRYRITLTNTSIKTKTGRNLRTRARTSTRTSIKTSTRIRTRYVSSDVLSRAQVSRLSLWTGEEQGPKQGKREETRQGRKETRKGRAETREREDQGGKEAD